MPYWDAKDLTDEAALESVLAKLTEDLRPIARLELEHGNAIAYVAEPAGTACPFAITFAQPLHKDQIEQVLTLAGSVRYWELHDPHYPIEAGYACALSRHALSGPLRKT